MSPITIVYYYAAQINLCYVWYLDSKSVNKADFDDSPSSTEVRKVSVGCCLSETILVPGSHHSEPYTQPPSICDYKAVMARWQTAILR